MFTDIHTHILPGIDDGAKDLEEAKDLLLLSHSQGIRSLWLTPHYYAQSETIDLFLEKREQSFRLIKPYLDAQNFNYRLGAEVYLSSVLLNFIGLDRLCISGTDFLLIELPYQGYSVEQQINMIKQLIEDYPVRIILAHVDRYDFLRREKNLKKFLELGVELQLNLSFLDHPGRQRKKWLEYLRLGHIRFLGTDTHNMRGRRPIVDKYWPELKRQLPSRIINSFFSIAFILIYALI